MNKQISQLRLKKLPVLGDLSKLHLDGLNLIFQSENSFPELLGLQWNLEINKSRGQVYTITQILRFCEVYGRQEREKIEGAPKIPEVLQRLKSIKDTWFFDEVIKDKESISLGLPILAQFLFEKYQLTQTRLLLCKTKSEELQLVLAVKMPFESELALFAWDEGLFRRQSADNLTLVTEENFFVSQADSPEPVKSGSVFFLYNFKSEMMRYTVSGRSECDKRHKQEDEFIAKVNGEEEVPFELFFHPYYRAFGHTTIRIGSVMYELGTKGWKAYKPDESSARVFLFNNPFFKSQHQKYGNRWMAPFSVGTTLFIKKSILMKIQEELDERCRTASKLQFNILLNNCNQGIVNILNKKGLKEVRTNGYYGFSAVLSFRSFLYDYDFKKEEKRIYIMPGHKLTTKQMRDLFPQRLYRDNSIGKEIVKGWPVYAVDLMMGPANFIRRNVAKTLKGGIQRKKAVNSSTDIIENSSPTRE